MTSNTNPRVDYLPWKQYVAKNYGMKRLDMSMVGLLWMELAEIDIKEILENKRMVFP